MSDELESLDIETYSDSELVALVEKTIPIVTIHLEATKKLIAKNENSIPNPCKQCEKYETCQNACELLEAQLSGKYTGGSILNNTFGTLDDIAEVNESNDDFSSRNNLSSYFGEVPPTNIIFERYQNCAHIFTSKQMEVLSLRFKDGMTITQIASRLNLSIGSVGDRLRRAKKAMVDYYSKLRHDAYNDK